MSTSELIGASPKFTAVLEDVRTVATADCSVLIRGETGTGKEVIARAIHDASPRRQRRFVVINCAAINGTRVFRDHPVMGAFGADDGNQTARLRRG